MFLNEGLEESNKTLITETNFAAKELEEKTFRPETREKAIIWYPRFQLANKITTDVYTYIESLKNSVLKDTPISEEKAGELYHRLQKTKDDLFIIDPRITTTFREILVFTSRQFDTMGSSITFYNTFFKKASHARALALLSKFQNNIQIGLNRLTNFCTSQVGDLGEESFYNVYTAIISQNIRHVRPGEDVEIKAGLGYFSKKGNPVFKINGTHLDVNEDGYVQYKITASGKPGIRHIPVELIFTDDFGKKQIKQVNVEYIIEEK